MLDSLDPVIRDARLAAEKARPGTANPYADTLLAKRWEIAYRQRQAELHRTYSEREAV